MLSRLKTGSRRPYSKAILDWDMSKIRVLQPRLWVILLVLAVPFFMISAHYFESFERTGPTGALIADTMFPAMLVSYFVLLFVLKQRRI